MSGLPDEGPADRRPTESLFAYYVLTSLLLGPFFFVILIPLYFRYHTLRYHFDREGITMRWGILFRREISLTYARIQDIHLSSNIVERWLGLARVQIQTASGNAGAEMTIEGLKDYEAIRDFLYASMRGGTMNLTDPASVGGQMVPGGVNEVTAHGGERLLGAAEAIGEAARELRALRLHLEQQRREQ